MAFTLHFAVQEQTKAYSETKLKFCGGYFKQILLVLHVVKLAQFWFCIRNILLSWGAKESKCFLFSICSKNSTLPHKTYH